MLKALQHFNKKHALFNKDTDNLLLAVSGGVDSMVMLHLLQQLNVPLAVAHCNFQLRGTESDADEQLVKNYSKQHDLQVFVRRFATKSLAREHGISIEMAARQLRYDWFSQLCEEHGYTKIATAHHAGDALETLLYNLSKGTGIHGLQGIKPKRDNIIRPILFSNRRQIEKYAQEHQLPWRTDASNLENIYHRNRIRNEVVPELEKINPNLENTISATLERIRATADLLQTEVDSFNEIAVEEIAGGIRIKKEVLQKHRHSLLMLNEILTPYQFNYQQAKQIEEALKSIPGKVFYSSTHQLNIDREWLFINAKQDKQEQIFTITAQTKQLEMTEGTLLITQKSKENYTFSNQRNVAALDLGKLKFPIKVRPWQQGDKFKPLGMRGNKKISDFLIDQKIPLNLKNEIYLLESKNQVVWIINHRIDDRFKISEETHTVLEITFLPHDQPF